VSDEETTLILDNPINQNILSMFLRKKKIKHQSAKDGLEAVEKWRTGGFHLILVSALATLLMIDGYPTAGDGRY
jgi:CheY-like chemotaxis protein